MLEQTAHGDSPLQAILKHRILHLLDRNANASRRARELSRRTAGVLAARGSGGRGNKRLRRISKQLAGVEQGGVSSVVGGGFVELELGFGCVASSWLSLLSFPHHLICLRGGV